MESIAILTALALTAGSTGAAFESSRECAECHTDIYTSDWGSSMHARSLSDPVFRTQFEQVADPEQQRICLGCHAPLALYDNDMDLEKATTQEGVTCDFCHTVTRLLPVTFDSPLRFALRPGNVKTGPYAPETLIEKGHKNEATALHREAAFCAGCHEVVNKFGLHVMSTYSEWSQSTYARQRIACQNCHMPQDIRFTVVSPTVGATTHTVTSHAMLGGHSMLQLRGAGKLDLRAYHSDGSLEVSVGVTNSEAGHFLPTGLPSRKVVLTVSILDGKGNPLTSQQVEYKRVLGDTQGREIPSGNVPDLFLNSSSVLLDTRLRPKEIRTERMNFGAQAPRGPLTVSATLDYKFEPPIGGRTMPPMRISEEILELPIRPLQTGPIYLLGLFILLLASIVLLVRKRAA